MGNLRSYFKRNNTILFNSETNTARNPVIDLYFGQSKENLSSSGYSRFIFDLDLTLLNEKISDKTISSDCGQSMTHILHMTNTIKFDDDLINTFNSENRRRASSFDLILFRIPLSGGITGTTQQWDEGIGYDYYGKEIYTSRPYGFRTLNQPLIDKNYSDRPSNWFMTTNITQWSENGIYDNTNDTNSNVKYSDLVIVDEQHFEIGNEDIQFDMTNEINGILDGSITGVTGWGIAFKPDIELITGLTTSYSVSFFSKYTQTFYKPYLLTTYDDLIEDDRNTFVENKINKLYLYVYEDGDFKNLDENPEVNILDNNGDSVPGMSNLPSCQVTKGIYKATIPTFVNYPIPCEFNDVWTNIKVSTDYGNNYPDIQNSFILKPVNNKVITSINRIDDSDFGFNFFGINQGEKIINTDVRKIVVNVKKAYTTNHSLPNINVYYKIYVLEGETEVIINDWTKFNRSSEEYFILFDTRDKIPNEYYVDIRIDNNGTKKTHERIINFEIVNQK